MNGKPCVASVVALAVALSLLASGGAYAQRDRNDGGRPEGGRQNDARGDRGDGPRNDRGPGPQGDRGDRGDGGRLAGGRNPQAWQDPRGAGPEHQYYRGQRYPSEFRGHQYVVEDWRGHHLRQPPRGYHWVQNGGDYLLVAIASGVILDLLLNH